MREKEEGRPEPSNPGEDFSVVGLIRGKKERYLAGGSGADLGFLGLSEEEARKILGELSNEHGLELPSLCWTGLPIQENPVFGVDFILFQIIRADPEIRREFRRRREKAGFPLGDQNEYQESDWLTDEFLSKTLF